jgi:SAM-dependent methyltransferase
MIHGTSSSKVYSSGPNEPALELIPPHATRILDVGCGTGENAKLLKAQNPSRYICGLTISEREADVANTVMDDVIVADVEKWEPASSEPGYDAILFCHILEHLTYPQRLLERASRWLNPGGHIVIAIPNVVYIEQRLQFLLGRFRYTQAGILDNTHLRFFDHPSIDRLVGDAGFRVTVSIADPLIPLGQIRWSFPRLAESLDRAAARVVPDLVGWQFVIAATPRSVSPRRPADREEPEMASLAGAESR